jgi:hypothetical protein
VSPITYEPGARRSRHKRTRERTATGQGEFQRKRGLHWPPPCPSRVPALQATPGVGTRPRRSHTNGTPRHPRRAAQPRPRHLPTRAPPQGTTGSRREHDRAAPSPRTRRYGTRTRPGRPSTPIRRPAREPGRAAPSTPTRRPGTRTPPRHPLHTDPTARNAADRYDPTSEHGSPDPATPGHTTPPAHPQARVTCGTARSRREPDRAASARIPSHGHRPQSVGTRSRYLHGSRHIGTTRSRWEPVRAAASTRLHH